METRRLANFIAIVDCGSLTRAAERMHVAQPALSQQLAGLEAQVERLATAKEGREEKAASPAEAIVPASGAGLACLAGFFERAAFFLARFGLAVPAGFAARAGFAAPAGALSLAMARPTALPSMPACGKQKPPAASRTMPISTPAATCSIRPSRACGAAPSNSPMALTISRPSSSVMIVA